MIEKFITANNYIIFLRPLFALPSFAGLLCLGMSMVSLSVCL